MTALRTTPLAATRAPLGSAPIRDYPQAAELAAEAVVMWPGIAWGHDARCKCSWAWRAGMMQVKVRNGECPVHRPEPPLPVLLGRLIELLAEAFEDERAGGCGTRGGYHRHLREKTRVCPGCREAEREDVRRRARTRKHATAASAGRAAA